MRNEDGTFTEPLGGNAEGVVTCYMSKCDWDYEIGLSGHGNMLYPNVRSILKHDPTMPDYGVVEVEVRKKRDVLKADYGPKRGERCSRWKNNDDSSKTEERGYYDDDLKFVMETTNTWRPSDPEYWGAEGKKRVEKKWQLTWHLQATDRFTDLKEPEEYKRGLLQAALSFGVIDGAEWQYMVKQHCPSFAK